MELSECEVLLVDSRVENTWMNSERSNLFQCASRLDVNDFALGGLILFLVQFDLMKTCSPEIQFKMEIRFSFTFLLNEIVFPNAVRVNKLVHDDLLVGFALNIRFQIDVFSESVAALVVFLQVAFMLTKQTRLHTIPE